MTEGLWDNSALMYNFLTLSKGTDPGQTGLFLVRMAQHPQHQEETQQESLRRMIRQVKEECQNSLTMPRKERDTSLFENKKQFIHPYRPLIRTDERKE